MGKERGENHAFSIFPPLTKGRVRVGSCNAEDFSNLLSSSLEIENGSLCERGGEALRMITNFH
jgi:hypothetical protein